MTKLQVKLGCPTHWPRGGDHGPARTAGPANLLREAVRSRRIARLAQAREKIAAAGIPPLTMEEIQAEIKADRTERRTKNAG